MKFGNEEGNLQQASAKTTDDISPVRLRNNHVNRLMKEENRRSLPLLSIHNAHHTNKNNNGHEVSSESFEDTMRLNAQFVLGNKVNKSKSPKPRHRNRSHSSKTATVATQKAFRHFDVEDFTRSYSDSAIQIPKTDLSRKTVKSNDISHWSYVNPQEVKRSTHIEHKDGETACHMIANGFSSSKDEDILCPAVGVPKIFHEVDNEVRQIEPPEELFYKNFQKGGETTLKAELMLSRIEKFENICQQNYEHVKSEILSEFTSLTELIEERKRALLDEVENVYNRKLTSFGELRMGWKAIKEVKNTIKTNNCESLAAHPIHNSSTIQNVDMLEQNGIKEPWETKKYFNGTHSESSGKNDDTPLHSDELLSTNLEEGNISFSINKTEFDFVKNIGEIEEDLSSPQYTYLTGSPQGNILVGDTVSMQVYTRNLRNEETYNPKDHIEVAVYDEGKKQMRLETIPTVAQKLEHILLFAGGNNVKTSNEKHHAYSFKPKKPGKFEISVKLNGADIKLSPYTCIAYAKKSLTFQNNISDIKTQRSLSSETENGSCVHHDWIVKKGGKSCLLTTLGDKQCWIYANQTVTDSNGWKIRLTSACSDIVFSIGVATRTGVPEIDEQFECQFLMKTFNKKVNRDRNIRRRESQFTRPPITFSMLLKHGFLRVTSDELNEDKHVEVRLSLGKNFSLYPFCSMIHCHNELFSQVCPSPQITFL